jgi:predicted DNA-binding protein YlxM (UPF0122 family)
MKIKTSDIIIRDDYYPRLQINESKVHEYAENIDVLPPIHVNKDNILIDGRLRLEAHNLINMHEIECEIEDITEEKILQRATELNAKHGMQLSYKEKQRLAVKIFNGSNGKHLASILSVSQDTLNKWVRPSRELMKKQQEESILDDYLTTNLSQKEIAEKHCVQQSLITDLKEKNSEKINLLISNKEKAPAKLKEKYPAIASFIPKSTNIWDDVFIDEFNLGGVSKNDSVLFKNLIHYYSRPFDTIVDYTQGSKQTCRSFFRRYQHDNNSSKTPALLIIEADDSHQYIEEIKKIKSKMKDNGYISILTHKMKEPFQVYDSMKSIGATLVENIIITYPTTINIESQLAQGYENILVFSFTSKS